MYRLLLISCLFGFLCAFPINPWDITFIQQQMQPQLIYIGDRPYYDATTFQRSELSQPLTANLICASVPVGRLSPDFVGSIQSAAQGLAGQAQGVAQALGGQIPGQIADAIGAPVSAAQQLVPVAKENEEKRDIPMIKIPITEPRAASGSSIEAVEGATKDVDEPELTDKAIPVVTSENTDDDDEDED
ncbi:hypothetical protein ACFFRR_007204 [Megaselia abdita]